EAWSREQRGRCVLAHERPAPIVRGPALWVAEHVPGGAELGQAIPRPRRGIDLWAALGDQASVGRLDDLRVRPRVHLQDPIPVGLPRFPPHRGLPQMSVCSTTCRVPCRRRAPGGCCFQDTPFASALLPSRTRASPSPGAWLLPSEGRRERTCSAAASQSGITATRRGLKGRSSSPPPPRGGVCSLHCCRCPSRPWRWRWTRHHWLASRPLSPRTGWPS